MSIIAKPGISAQEKLTKQNEISRQKLARELRKLEKAEKSDLRMLETSRHRFRLHRGRVGARAASASSNAISVRMYETHNPGFCYHRTGTMKQPGPAPKEKRRKDPYELVRSMLFTDGEVDPVKVLCLHLLAAHSPRTRNNATSEVRPVASLLEKGKEKCFSGAWNNMLPCYVMDIERNVDLSMNMKLHEDPLQIVVEEQALREFEEKYRRFAESNMEFGLAMSSNAKQTKMAPNGVGTMPIVSPHVYSLLGASQEFKIKQAVAETRRRFGRSSVELDTLYERCSSLRSGEEDDLTSVKCTADASGKRWRTRLTRSPSKRSALGPAYRIDRGITMLKHDKPVEETIARASRELHRGELVTIKSSTARMHEEPSTTSSTRSQFRNIFERDASVNSLLSSSLTPGSIVRRCRRYIYLNSPIECPELRSRDYATVPILVNYQIQALVHTVLDVLQRANSDKVRRIMEIASSPDEIRKVLMSPEVLDFVESLKGQPLISSPESFVVSAATLVDEIDSRFEEVLEKELVALTLDTPPVVALDELVTEIRNNIFQESKMNVRASESSKERSRLADDVGHRRANKVNNADESVNTSTAYKDSSTNVHGSPTFVERPTSPRHTYKPRKTMQDTGSTDSDRIILRRLTNAQRILVGQMCASLKTRKVNAQGLINERMPLAALIAPALSRESIKILTRGTAYSKISNADEIVEEKEEATAVVNQLTGPLLAKVRQEIAENETKQRLKIFLRNNA